MIICFKPLTQRSLTFFFSLIDQSDHVYWIITYYSVVYFYVQILLKQTFFSMEITNRLIFKTLHVLNSPIITLHFSIITLSTLFLYNFWVFTFSYIASLQLHFWGNIRCRHIDSFSIPTSFYVLLWCTEFKDSKSNKMNDY